MQLTKRSMLAAVAAGCFVMTDQGAKAALDSVARGLAVQARPYANFKYVQDILIARYEAAQIGRRNPHYVPAGNGLMPSAGNGLLPSTAAPTITTTGTQPTNITTYAKPPTAATVAGFAPYIKPQPNIASFRVGNQGLYVRTSSINAPTNYAVDSGFLTATVRWEFNTDDPKPTIEIQGTGNYVRVIVDDQFMDLVGFQPDPAAANGTRYATLDFTQGGTYTVAAATKTRNIKIEMSGSCVVGRIIRSSVIYDVFASPQGPVLAFVGDSWGQGIGAAHACDNLANCTADWMGCSDLANLCVSGTGYLTPAGNTVETYLERLSDIAQINPDVLVIGGLTNDISALNSALITEANFVTRITTYFSKLRAVYPGKPVVVMSGSIPSQAMLTAGTNLENDLATVITNMIASGDTRIAHVRTIVPANGDPWISGSGSDSVPAGDGNRDIYGSSGSGAAQHLNAGGYNYFGKRGAREIANAIRAMS